MPRRLSDRAYDFAYQMLVYRDGERCANCGTGPPPGRRLDIEHRDHNKHNWGPENLRLYCRSHNTAKENRRRSGSPKSPRPDSPIQTDPRDYDKAPSPSNRVCETPGSLMRHRKAALRYEDGSPEQRANGLYHPHFIQWLEDWINEHGAISFTEAINSGAFVTGASTETIARYLKPLASEAGPYQLTTDMLGQKSIVRRDPGPGPEPPLPLDEPLRFWNVDHPSLEQPHVTCARTPRIAAKLARVPFEEATITPTTEAPS